jgi:hypothetical protein
MARAIKGGEVAPNGEFYKGGQFINTIAENDKRAARPKTPKTGKREIEPYVWAVQPFAGAKSIFRALAGLGGKMTDAGTFVIYEPVFERLGDRTTWGETLEECQALCDAYNNGERWTE